MFGKNSIFKIKNTKRKKKKSKHNNKHQKQTFSLMDDYGQEFGFDENFSFIAGFTDGGIPYGTTWEEDNVDTSLSYEDRFKQLQEKWEKGNKTSVFISDEDEELFDRLADMFDKDIEFIDDDGNQTNKEEMYKLDIEPDDLPFY